MYYLAYSAAAVAGGTGYECRAVFGACAVAVVAFYPGRYLERFVYPGHYFLEGKFYGDAQI